MAINAELFDGTILEFPDGTDPSVIQQTAKRLTAERQAAPAKKEAPVPEVGMPEIEAFNQPGTPKRQLKGSVMEGYQPKQGEALPELPALGTAERKAYDIATPEERQAMAAESPEIAKIQEAYKAREAALPPMLKGQKQIEALDTRLENRIQDIARKTGADYETALALAKQQIMSEEEGAPKVGQIVETPKAVSEAQEEYGFKPGMKPYEEAGQVLKRSLASGYYGMVQAGGGQVRFLKDMLGMESVADTEAGLDDVAMRVQGMGQAPSKPVQYIEGAINSITQQLPAMAAGALTGSEALVLGSMFLNSFGQTYDDSRREGLDVGDSTYRGAAYAAFEVLGEKLGLGDTLKGIKAAAKGVPEKELLGYFAKALAKEVPGEEATYAGQFAVDKGLGLNPEAGFKEFLSGAVDTMAVTVLQGGMMMGGGASLNKIVKSLSKIDPKLEEVLPTKEEIKEGKTELKAPPPPATEEEAKNEAPERRSFRERITSLIDNWKKPAAAEEVAPTQENFDKLVSRYESQGETTEMAQMLATQAIKDAEDAGRVEPRAGEPSVSVPDQTGAAVAGTEEAGPTGLAGTAVAPTGVGVGERVQPDTLATAEPVATQATPVAAPITVTAESLANARDNAKRQSATAERAQVSLATAQEKFDSLPEGAEKKKAETALKRAQTRATVSAKAAQMAQDNLSKHLTAAEEQGVSTEEVAPKKRGRPAKAEGEKKITPPERKKLLNENNYKINKALKVIDEVVNPNDFEDTEEGATQYQNARTKLTTKKVESLKDVFRIKNDRNMKGTPAAAKATEIWESLDAKAKNAIETMVKNEDIQQRSATVGATEGVIRSTTGTPNDKFFKFTNATQAIAWIQKHGNEFEQLLARRIRPFLNGIKLVVVTDPSTLPDRVRQHFEGAKPANGLYDVYNGQRTIYLDGTYGINFRTFLHEALHGATISRINQLKLAREQGKALPKDLQEALHDLEVLMGRVNHYYEDLLGQFDQLPDTTRYLLADMLDFDEIGVFTDIKEFVAYGFTDPRLQEFLQLLPGRIEGKDVTKANGFTRFVANIRKFFRMDESHDSALQDLIAVTDKLIGEPIYEGPDVSGLNVTAASKRQDEIDAAMRKITLSERADQFVSAFDELLKVRSWGDAKKYLQTAYKTMDSKKLSAVLPALTSWQIIDWVGKHLPHLQKVHSYVEKMNVMRAKMLTYVDELSQPWVEFNKKYIKGAKVLARIMHYTTMVDIDPTMHADVTAALANDPVLVQWRTDRAAADPKDRPPITGKITKREKRIRNAYTLWNELGTYGNGKGQEIYKNIKQFYQNTFDKHRAILNERIAALQLEGDIDDASTPKGRLMTAIRATYEGRKNIGVYFPLMRYGQYWARVGLGRNKEFYMFESEFARNAFIADRLERLKAAGDTRTEAKMREDGDLESGNDLTRLREQATEGSKMLTKIFNIIDSSGDAVNKNELKDSVYQMYLMTMPEQSFRSQFVHRKGTAGFSGDVLRNFIRSGYSSASQLSHLRFSPGILSELDAANDSLKGNPDRERLETFVREFRMRVHDDLHPDIEDRFAQRFANGVNQATFLYFLTSIKSGLNNFIAIPQFGLPVLGARYGIPQATAKLGTYMNIFNHWTVLKDGKLIMPSIGESRHVQSDPVLKQAFKDAFNRGVTEITRTYDLLGMSHTPSEQYTGTLNKYKRMFMNAMGGAFHHSERLNREIMYMATFELAYEKALKDPTLGKDPYREDPTGKGNHGAAYARAVDEAVRGTYDSMFDYSKFNRPRAMRSVPARLIFQFKMFPQQVTGYYVKSGMNTYHGLVNAAKNITPETVLEELVEKYAEKDRPAALEALRQDTKAMQQATEEADKRRTAALRGAREGAVQLIGSLLMTGVFSGLAGWPLYSMIVGVIQGIMDKWRDEDEFVPFEERDVDYWFRNVYLPEKFGDFWANSIATGIASEVTGADIHSGTSLDNLWWRDTTHDASMSGTIGAWAEQFLGAGYSMLTNFIKGVDDIAEGHVSEGVDKFLPAGLRGMNTAARWMDEGVQAKTHDVQLIDKDEVTKTMLMWKVLGYNPTALSHMQKANSTYIDQVSKATKEREEILRRIEIALANENDSKFEAELDRIPKFNAQNPDMSIKAESVQTRIKNAAENRAKAIHGVIVPEKLRPRAAQMLGNLPE